MTYRQLPGDRPLLSERNKADSARMVLWCIAAGIVILFVSATAFYMQTEPVEEVQFNGTGGTFGGTDEADWHPVNEPTATLHFGTGEVDCRLLGRDCLQNGYDGCICFEGENTVQWATRAQR